ncbi:MAG: carboxymuconolactone decarboxylase family protein [Flavisolibacter sp.]
MTILQGFIFGAMFYTGKMSDKIRELITITALATNQMLLQLKAHTAAALNIGVKPITIGEVLYQSAPFVDYPKS